MILVLSSQHFSLLILVSVGNVSLPLVCSNEINRLQNISSCVSLKGPLVCLYEISIVSYVNMFTQFLVFFCQLFSIHYYVRTILVLFPCNVSLYITSFFYRLVFTTFLHTLVRSSIYQSKLCPLRFSICCQQVRMILVLSSQFFRVLVHSYDKSTLLSVSLYVRMFIRYQSCLLNVYPYVSANLVVFPTFLRNLLSHSHRSSSVRSVFFRSLHMFLRNQFCLITFLRKLVVAYFIGLSISSTCPCTLVCWQCLSQYCSAFATNVFHMTSQHFSVPQ